MPSHDFLWVGNHPGLDFCNTEPILEDGTVELLAAPADLQDWLGAAGAASRSIGWRPSTATLGWARSLRHAMRDLLDPTVANPKARQELNAVLAEVPATAAIGTDGRLELVAGDPDMQLRLDLMCLVVTATELDSSRLRRCANPACVLLFYDASKSGQRRWHDMSTCGNRAKAAAHYARTRRTRSAASDVAISPAQ